MTVPSHYWYIISQKNKEMPRERIENAYQSMDEMEESIQGQEISDIEND